MVEEWGALFSPEEGLRRCSCAALRRGLPQPAGPWHQRCTGSPGPPSSSSPLPRPEPPFDQFSPWPWPAAHPHSRPFPLKVPTCSSTGANDAAHQCKNAGCTAQGMALVLRWNKCSHQEVLQTKMLPPPPQERHASLDAVLRIVSRSNHWIELWHQIQVPLRPAP